MVSSVVFFFLFYFVLVVFLFVLFLFFVGGHFTLLKQICSLKLRDFHSSEDKKTHFSRFS